MRFSLKIHSDEYVIDPREPSHGKNMTFQLVSMSETNGSACCVLESVAGWASERVMIDGLTGKAGLGMKWSRPN
jgi:hypothetical protein